jgi:hypothetical protein
MEFRDFITKIMYIIMIICIIISFIIEFDTRDLSQKFIPKFTIIIIIIGFFIYLTSENSKRYIEKIKNKENNPIQYVRRVNKENYERECIETTERELKKLYNSSKFLEMYYQKGEDKANWVWQTEEKKKRKKWNESTDSDINSEELEKLTFSVSI